MQQLERECRGYLRYLCRQSPSIYITEKYVDFHRKGGAALELDEFDRFLVRFSTRNILCARLADSYARVFRKESAVRKKLILLLALMESAPETYERLDRVPAGGFTGAVVRLGVSSATFILALSFATVILAPTRFWLSRQS
jgi:hypothetical protein